MPALAIVTFSKTGPVASGAWPLSFSPKTVPTSKLPAAVLVGGLLAERGWTPKPGATVAVDTSATKGILGEFALDLWVSAAKIVDPVTVLSGSGSPAELLLRPGAMAGSFTVTATIRTSGAPVVLLSDDIFEPDALPVRIGVWVSGTDAVLALQGVANRRLRFARSVPDAKGKIVIAGPPKGSTSSVTVIAATLYDELDAAEVATLSAAADAGLGEIDSVLAAGAYSQLGAPTGPEHEQGGVRWREFQHGDVYWSRHTGAQSVTGGILTTYRARGGFTGPLGLPTSPEMSPEALQDLLTNDIPVRRVPGGSGLTVGDVLTRVGDLDADDIIVDYTPTRRRPRPTRTWDSILPADATVSGSVASFVPALDADWLASVLGHAPQTGRRSVRRRGARDPRTGEPIVIGGIEPHDRIDRLIGAGGRLNLPDAGVGLSAAALGRVARLPRPTLPAVNVRVFEAYEQGRSRSIAVEREAITTFAARVGEQLATGAVTAGQVARMDAGVRLRHPAITQLVRGTDDLARPLDEALRGKSGRNVIRDLIAISAREGVELTFEVDGAIWKIIGPRAQRFQHGVIVWSRPGDGVDIYDEIVAHWTLLGGVRGFLGLPRAAEADWLSGREAVFSGGRIYWSKATGAHVVQGAILAHCLTQVTDQPMFVPPTNGMFLGFPLGDEETIASVRAKRSVFERGHVYWTSKGGVQEVPADVVTAMQSTGGLDVWGLPIGPATVIVDGAERLTHQPFRRGRVVARSSGGGAAEAVQQLQVRVSRVVAYDIDDTGPFAPHDHSAELYVKAWVWVDGSEVFHAETHGTASSPHIDSPEWRTSLGAIPTATARNVRVRIEAWDWDSTPGGDDALAWYDRTFGISDGFLGMAVAPGAWGDFRQSRATDFDPNHASRSSVQFDWLVERQETPSLDRMREKWFWHRHNRGRDNLPWNLMYETFVDITSPGPDTADPYEKATYAGYRTCAEGGNCFGFSSSALDSFHHRGAGEPLGDKNVTYSDADVNWATISRGQGSQRAATVDAHRSAGVSSIDACDPRAVFARLEKSIAETGAPGILDLWTTLASKTNPGTWDVAGHAVLVHRCVRFGSTLRMLIADSNVPWPEQNSDVESRIDIAPNGSYTVFPVGMYKDWAAPAWTPSALGKRYMMDIPYGLLGGPLRTRSFDASSGLVGLTGGWVETTGAAVTQVAAGDRRLLGDQWRILEADARARNRVLDALAKAGIVRTGKRTPASQAASGAAVDPERLRSLVELVGPGLRGSALAARLSDVVRLAPGASSASSAWGRIEREHVAHGLVDPDQVAVITPGAWPGVALIHDATDAASPDIVLFRGYVPDRLTITLEGRAGGYRQTMAGQGGVIAVESALASGAVETLDAIGLSTLRPGLEIGVQHEERAASVDIAGPRGSGMRWSIPVTLGPSPTAVRWLPGRPGLTVRNGGAVAAVSADWSHAGTTASYRLPASNAGDTTRIVPNDPASPSGAMRVQRLSPLGDLITSELIDPT